jgi:hypothetical protein
LRWRSFYSPDSAFRVSPNSTLRLTIQRRTLTIAAISLLFAVVSVLLLIFRWQVAPPTATHLNLGDPTATAAHY